MADVNPKLCECGCGKPAPIAKSTNRRCGHVRGQPIRFVLGHATRRHHGCKVDGCVAAHCADGYCQKHYGRNRVHGDASIVLPRLGPITHGHATKGRSPTYRSWVAMRTRCTNPKAKDFPRYGGRGITVCDRWLHSFESFLEDMGERRPGMTIERDDANGSYEPGNCRWATQSEQTKNYSRNHMLTAFGETHALSVWADRNGIPRSALAARIAHGWPVEQALTSPVTPGLHRTSR